ASRPDRSVEAAEVLLGLLRGLPIHPLRFERARASAVEHLLGSRARFRGYGLVAESWRVRGLDGDPRPDILRTLERMTIDDLREFVAPLARDPIGLLLVGDTTRMDMQALERLGGVEQRTLDELVVY